MVQISGGDRLAKKLAEIARNLDKAAEVDVGFFSQSTYPDGTSVPLVAAVQEWGSPSRNIPPRPFFRGMIEAKSPEWPQAVGDLLVANDYDAQKTLGQAGEAIRGQLQQSIVDFVGAPLKPATAARKHSEKQLVDTGVLLGSVGYEVKS